MRRSKQPFTDAFQQARAGPSPQAPRDNEELRIHVKDHLPSRAAGGGNHAALGAAPSATVNQRNQEPPGTIVGLYQLPQQIGKAASASLTWLSRKSRSAEWSSSGSSTRAWIRPRSS